MSRLRADRTNREAAPGSSTTVTAPTLILPVSSPQRYARTPSITPIGSGVGTILVVLGVAWVWPEIRKYARLDA